MPVYWSAALIVWLIVMAVATPGAWAAAIKQSQRRGDPMRLAVWLVGLIIAGGTLRWLTLPNDQGLWKAVYVVTVLTGIYVVWLMVAYGRGPLISRHPAEESEGG